MGWLKRVFGRQDNGRPEEYEPESEQMRFLRSIAESNCVPVSAVIEATRLFFFAYHAAYDEVYGHGTASFTMGLGRDDKGKMLEGKELFDFYRKVLKPQFYRLKHWENFCTVLHEDTSFQEAAKRWFEKHAPRVIWSWIDEDFEEMP